VSGSESQRQRQAGTQQSVPLPSCARHLPDTNIAGQLLSAPVHCRGNWARGWRAAARLCWSSGCRGWGSRLGPHSPEGRGFAGWERRRGVLSQRIGSALEGMIESSLNSPTTFKVFVNSHSLIIPLLSEYFPTGRGLPLNFAFPCECSQNPIQASVQSPWPHRNLPGCRALAGLMFLFAGEKGQVGPALMDPAKVMLMLSIGRGVAEGTLAGFYQTCGSLRVTAQESQRLVQALNLLFHFCPQISQEQETENTDLRKLFIFIIIPALTFGFKSKSPGMILSCEQP